jgi:hypothetical protein
MHFPLSFTDLYNINYCQLSIEIIIYFLLLRKGIYPAASQLEVRLEDLQNEGYLAAVKNIQTPY